MKPILPLLVLIALGQPAHAEFSMVSNDAETASRPETAAVEKPSSPTTHKTAKHAKSRAHAISRHSPAKVSSSTTSTKTASGFGAQVPLAFAIRQMAPDGYEIVLEPPADPNSLVDWRGGRPWTQALADAVRPLGLTVSVREKTVTITEAAPR